LTNYERAIGLGKSQGASPARKKRNKRKLVKTEKQGASITKTTNRTSRLSRVCDRNTTVHEVDGDVSHRDCHSTCLRRCRGWFSSSWSQSSETPRHSDQTLVHVAETLAQRRAELQLSELRLECSSAAKWSELKRSRRKDDEVLLSSPVGVLWAGNVKPLIQPSQATSVGKLHFYSIC